MKPPSRLAFLRGCGLVLFSTAAVALLAAPHRNRVTRFATPSKNSQPGMIVAGPDGALWFAEMGSAAIGRITTDGTITEFRIPAGGVPTGITVGQDGAIWFAESTAGRIGRLTCAGSFTEYPISEGGQPVGIAAGPDGNIWYTNAAGTVGRLTPDGLLSEFAIPSGSPLGIAGGDSHVWYTVPYANKIGKMNAGGGFIEYPVPTRNGHPTAIVAGGDHNYWFIEAPLPGPFNPESRIGRISSFGNVLDFTTDVPRCLPAAIAMGPDGNLWFTDPPSNSIRAISPYGKLTREKIKADGPTGITAGPDGAIWFTEQPNGIGRISLDPDEEP
jgi:virginiamycin B lyase